MLASNYKIIFMPSAEKLMEPGPVWSTEKFVWRRNRVLLPKQLRLLCNNILYVQINERAQPLTKTDWAQNRQNTSIAWL